MVKNSTIPVLIVGGGVTGTLLALELGRHGVAARAIDCLPAPAPHSRALSIHARTLEILELIDPQLVTRFLERGISSAGYVLHFVGSDGERRAIRPALDFTTLGSRYPCVLIHRQDEAEQMLREYLATTCKRHIEWGVTCTEVQPDANHVLVALNHADGSTEQVRCSYLVACDGANSGIRRQLGLAQEGSEESTRGVLQTLDVQLHDFPASDTLIHCCMGADHFLTVARMPGDYYRLLLSVPADRAEDSATPEQLFSGILAQHFDGLRFGATLAHARWQSQVMQAQHYRHGRIFLAGDAAHVHTTAGGEGLNCGIQDAFNLGWKLALVVNGSAAAPLLDTYERERKPASEQMIGGASAIQELFLGGRNISAAGLQAVKRSGFLPALVGKMSGIAGDYREAALADGAEPPVAVGAKASKVLVAGDRVPNVELPPTRAGASLFDFIRHSGYTLLIAMPGISLSPAAVALATQLAVYGNALKIHVMAPAPVPYASPDARLYLVRPDGYLAFCCPLADSRLLRAWLARRVVGVGA